MENTNPIGFLDSGLGGLTITSEVIKTLPGENIVYYGDNLHMPYGPRPQAEVREFVLKIIHYLVYQQRSKYVVIACNTATVAALEDATEMFGVKILGPIEEGVKKALNQSKNKKIGILATEGTVISGEYQKTIKKNCDIAEPVAVACPKLAPLVEAGRLSGPEVELAVRDYLTPIFTVGCDTVILGCTHYPFLTEVIKKVSEGRLNIVFPGTEIAKKIKAYLQESNLLNPGGTGIEMYQTSNLNSISQEFLKMARKKLDLELNFQEYNIFDLVRTLSPE